MNMHIFVVVIASNLCISRQNDCDYGIIAATGRRNDCSDRRSDCRTVYSPAMLPFHTYGVTPQCIL